MSNITSGRPLSIVRVGVYQLSWVAWLDRVQHRPAPLQPRPGIFPDGSTEEISWEKGEATWAPAVMHVPENATGSAIVLIQMSGWLVHGFALYVLIAQLPGEITLWDPLFYAATSSVLGVGSGLPGGVGATEGLLGAALGMMKIPAEHLAFAVGGFRLATFWIWIPIGWLALGYVQRVAQRRNA